MGARFEIVICIASVIRWYDAPVWERVLKSEQEVMIESAKLTLPHESEA